MRGGHPHDASGAIVGNQAINTMVAGLAVEMSPDYRVNAVAPTWTPTGLWRNLTSEQVEQQATDFAQGVPLKRVATPDEVAAAYIYLMQNDFVTGQVLHVDGGVDLSDANEPGRFCPRLAFAKTYRLKFYRYNHAVDIAGGVGTQEQGRLGNLVATR